MNPFKKLNSIFLHNTKDIDIVNTNNNTRTNTTVTTTTSTTSTTSTTTNTTTTMHDSALGDSRISDYQENKGYYQVKQLSKADKRSFRLKRLLKPHKIYYELEHKNDWLQIDQHTSKGIDRIRKLGFSNLDFRLEQSLSRYYINEKQHHKKEEVEEEVLVEINYLPFIRKDVTNLLRIRRVHWWSKNYNLAIAVLDDEIS